MRSARLYLPPAISSSKTSEVAGPPVVIATEAQRLWPREGKGKPTIAGSVGGIPNQIIHKLTGVLVHSVEGCAFQIRYLLTHPDFARRIGASGREHVKENFLMTTNVKRWLLLFRILEESKAARAAAR